MAEPHQVAELERYISDLCCFHRSVSLDEIVSALAFAVLRDYTELAMHTEDVVDLGHVWVVKSSHMQYLFDCLRNVLGCVARREWPQLNDYFVAVDPVLVHWGVSFMN